MERLLDVSAVEIDLSTGGRVVSSVDDTEL
jgi:hypothetical protein